MKEEFVTGREDVHHDLNLLESGGAISTSSPSSASPKEKKSKAVSVTFTEGTEFMKEDSIGTSTRNDKDADYNSKLAGTFQNLTDQLEKVNRNKKRQDQSLCLTIVIILVGIALSVVFLVRNMYQIRHENQHHFDTKGSELIKSISQAWADFEVAGLWMHEACRSTADQVDGHIERGICTRKDFQHLYDYMVSTELPFQAAGWLPNCTQAQRDLYEDESRAFYKQYYPDIEYKGFVGLEPDATAPPPGFSLQKRSEQPFYFPAHYLLPVAGYNIPALDFDLYSNPTRRDAINIAIKTHEPSLTRRLELLDKTARGYMVILFHPGIPLTESSSFQEDEMMTTTPLALSLLVIRIDDLLVRSLRSQADSSRVVLFDVTDTPESPLFLGGADLLVEQDNSHKVTFLDDIEFSVLKEQNDSEDLFKQQDIRIGDRTWRAVVVPYEGTFDPDYVIVFLGSVAIFLVCSVLAFFFYWNARRQHKLNQLQAETESEKTQLIVESAHKTAIAERELNDFIAHEVRNPLSAAISAASFVSASLKSNEVVYAGPEGKKLISEDVDIIQSSLQYINDLLRNMLDWHRAGSSQLNIELAPTDLKQDILQPVATMLYRRNDNFEVIVECNNDDDGDGNSNDDSNMVVMTDRMRLKQIVLNFAMNSRKFTEKGYIKLSANIVKGHVKIYVEDTGPGIPISKRKNLFAKFQESLDTLNQGTGIGLSLCKKLSQLMNGDVYLDEDYDSGLEGCPGTRFVIDLNASPINMDSDDTLSRMEEACDASYSCRSHSQTVYSEQEEQPKELPENFKVLFVDDDLVLRKLFCRSLKRVAPGWEMSQAANGETAIRMCEEQDYDLIFMDQYMASVEKQLLGTETVRTLRAQGVECRICGLSANDTEESFLRSGADAFLFKPFPCQADALEAELLRIIYGGTITRDA